MPLLRMHLGLDLIRTQMHADVLTDDDKFATLAGFDVEKERCVISARVRYS